MAVAVIDFQNNSFEHEIFNLGLLEGLLSTNERVSVHCKPSLSDYYHREFPEIHSKLSWHDLGVNKIGGFSSIDSIKLALALARIVKEEPTHLVFTTTTPSSLFAANLVWRLLNKGSSIKFCFVFHGMLSNLEPQLALRPDPWIRRAKIGIPVIYPSRLLLSLQSQIKSSLASDLSKNVYFAFLTTKSMELFQERFKVDSKKLIFTPICIPTSLKSAAPSNAYPPGEAGRLKVGVLGWSSNSHLERLAKANPDVEFHIFGESPPLGLHNVRVYGGSLSRKSIQNAAEAVDVFMMPRKSPPSNWMLSGVPSEMLIFRKKLIVPNAMTIRHYGLPDDLTLQERDFLDSKTYKIREGVAPSDLALPKGLVEETWHSLEDAMRSNLARLIGS